ncbi:hypothetical protein FGG08_007682, partial [Glutinoglossum americanum]
IVDDRGADHAFGVDQEQAAQRDAGVLDQYAVITGDRLVEVGHERVAQVAQTAVLARGVAPGEVGELAVDRHADDFRAEGVEILDAIAEGDDFGRADEGEVEGVEEQRDPLALVVAELDFLDGAVGEDRLGLEVGGFFLNEGHESSVKDGG